MIPAYSLGPECPRKNNLVVLIYQLTVLVSKRIEGSGVARLVAQALQLTIFLLPFGNFPEGGGKSLGKSTSSSSAAIS